MLGGRIEEGLLKLNQRVRITRRDIDIGRGKLINLQQQKSDVQEVHDGEFGMQIESKTDISAGDIIDAFDVIIT